MTTSIESIIKNYGIDDFKTELILKGPQKIEFLNDLMELFKGVCRILDKLSNIASLRGAQLLMALAKLSSSESVINKSDIMNALNIDRLEKLTHAFDYLEQKNYIEIEEKTPRFHIVSLNKKDNPDLILFQEIVNKFWSTPQEQKQELKRWLNKDER